MADDDHLEIQKRIKAATDDIDIAGMEAENNKGLKELESILGSGNDEKEDPELLKELHAMGYTEDDGDDGDEEAELAKLWAAEHGADAPGTESKTRESTGTPAPATGNAPAAQQTGKPRQKQALKPAQPNPKRAKTDKTSKERKEALSSIEQRLVQFRRATLDAKNNKDLDQARYLFTFVKKIKNMKAAVGEGKMNPAKAIQSLPAFPPPKRAPKKSSSGSTRNSSRNVAKPVRNAVSKTRTSSARKAKPNQSRKTANNPKRVNKQAGVSSNSQLQVLSSYGVSTESRKGADNPKLSIKDNLKYATMIEKCERQAEMMNAEAKNCLLRRDKETARKLVRLRVQSLRDRDLLIKAQEKGALPCSCDYNALQVQKMVTHPELRADELAITLMSIHAGEDDSKKNSGASIFIKYEVNIPKPGATGSQTGQSSVISVGEDEIRLNHQSKFAFKRGARSTARRFGKGAKITFKVFETAKLRLFFGDKEIAKGEMKLHDLMHRCDIHAKVPLAKSKSSRAKTLLEVEVKAELREPIEGHDLRPFSIEYQVLRDDFSFPGGVKAVPRDAASPPPPSVSAPGPPTDRKTKDKSSVVDSASQNQSSTDRGKAVSTDVAIESQETPAKNNEPEEKSNAQENAVKIVKVKKDVPRKKVRPLPPGVTLEEIKNPNDILKFRSFDALEGEIKLLERKLKKGASGKLETRKKQAENIRDMMILSVQEGKMSMENYLDLLRLTIDHDVALAKEVEVRRKEEGKTDLFILQKRIETMKTELKTAEENC